MKRLQTYFLATACAALTGVAFAPSADAYKTCNGSTNCSLGTKAYTFGNNDVYGGGSSLVAPYWRQMSDCYANPADVMVKGSPPGPFTDEASFNWTGTNPQNCHTTHIITNATTWYISTGSGSGILGVFAHDPVTFWGEVNTNDGGQYFAHAHYGLSDAGLADNPDVNTYNNGGSYHQGTTTISIAAPGGVSCTGGSMNPYPNPADCYGPLVQFPFSVDPVAVFYTNGGIYEKVSMPGGGGEIDYKLNVQNPTTSGGLRLSVSSMCGIFNRQITDWNDSRLKADNSGVSLKDPSDPTSEGSWSVPLVPVARSDSSGTTSIITRHLANICSQFGYNLYTTGATTIANAGAGALVGSTYSTSSPNYPGVDQTTKITMAPNSSGVAQYVNFSQAPNDTIGDACGNATLPSGYTDCLQQSRIGYNGADYVMPFVRNSHTNNYALFSATLQNNAGAWVAPSVKAVLAAFSVIQPPQSHSDGTYCSSCLNFGTRNDPGSWVQSLSPTSKLADPTGKTSYPIVGTTNFLGYSCYASSNVESNLVGQLNYVETANINTATTGVLGKSGLGPLPAAWRTAIEETFINNADGLGLEISPVGGSAACTGGDIVGG
ncbi:MAG TPA: substrate-binding domain-containing protein [Rhizomicrobium sp.]|jgi:ABC-type phosphate transport system substrate-binding protein|nr:substrate-binding domain-containing protein [Rhizomicrobium sp.]